MVMLSIRDTQLYVDVRGTGSPLVLMHGGPGTDHVSLLPFRELADQLTLVFYDHRCNGRSNGAPVESMTWENLTADADALREKLGFEKWAVLGHSFGGHVALEYALRYPGSVSRLVLLDTGADSHWARENSLAVLAGRGCPPEKVELVRRWFTGEFEPSEMFGIFMKIADVYSYRPSRLDLVRMVLGGGWRTKFRGEPFIFASRHLLKNWSVSDRLGEIDVPTLVMAGRQDFVFPPECQRQMAAAIPNAKLHLVDRAGHNPDFERQAEVMTTIRDFLDEEASSPDRVLREVPGTVS
jgi:proline iminopeptidase